MEKYNREAFQHAQEEIKLADEERKEQIRERLNTPSLLDKHSMITYQAVENALKFFRGNSLEQAKKKLERLNAQANQEASELNEQHEALKMAVEKAAVEMREAISRLERFEGEALGINS